MAQVDVLDQLIASKLGELLVAETELHLARQRHAEIVAAECRRRRNWLRRWTFVPAAPLAVRSVCLAVAGVLALLG